MIGRLRGRSPQELAFRLRQETANLRLLAMGVRAGEPPAAQPLSGLEDPQRAAQALAGTEFESESIALAQSVQQHCFPLLTLSVPTGPEIDWRRDYLAGLSSGTEYFRRVPYLDAARVGDHKVIWELNRHQHFPLLAMAWRFSGDASCLDTIGRHLLDWRRANPFQRGINWASALEVAFRAMSWLWTWHLAGEALPEAVRRELWAGLAEHGSHLEHNLSVYFSPNTHLLGEGLALESLGCLMPALPRAARWAGLGREVVEDAMRRQVRTDGSHFEESSYYHLYATDMMLWHTALQPGAPGWFLEKLGAMGGYLAALVGDTGRLPLLGDDDGGRWFHPYGTRECFATETLAALSGAPGSLYRTWWSHRLPVFEIPSTVRTHFPDAALAIHHIGASQVLFRAARISAASGGHSHADALSILVRQPERDLLIDPGTYTYVSDPEARDWFRGTAGHNTLRINSRDQADPAGPFRWANPPETQMLSPCEAVCSYRGFTHRRKLDAQGSCLVIEDTVSGPPGEHLLEQFWHLAEPRDAARIEAGGLQAERGWRSEGLGSRVPAPVLVRRERVPLPVTWTTRIDCS